MRRRARQVPGIVALGFALIGLASVVIAISMAAPAAATETAWAVSTVLAWFATGITVAAVALGLFAAIARLGRWWGVAAMVIGVLSNPWLQVTVLGALA